MVTETKEKEWYDWFEKHWIISIFLILIFFGMISSIFDSGDNSEITGNVVSEQSEQIQEKVKTCTPNWNCGSWFECGASGIQRRVCTDSENCETDSGKPSEIQNCEYVIQQEIKQETEKETSSEEDFSWSDWWNDLEKTMNDLEESQEQPEEESPSEDWAKDLKESLEETTSIYKKIDECTELCAGEDINIPYIKSVCHSDCYQIYYYTGEESLNEYIAELRG